MGIGTGVGMDGEHGEGVSADASAPATEAPSSTGPSRAQVILAWLRRFMPLLTALGTLLMGGFFLARTSVGHTPDVWSHVYRISSITHGDLLAHPVHSRSLLHDVGEGVVGGRVDRAWADYAWSTYDGYDPSIALRESVEPGSGDLVDLPFNNTATNSPVSYAPQILAFGVGGILHLPVSVIYRAAEVCMLLVYSLCMFLGVRVLTRWRIGVGLTMLFPPLLFRSSFAISADSFTQAVVFLFTCMVFRAVHEKVSHRYCLLLGVVGLVVAMSKFIYMPLVLVMLLVPLLQKWVRGLDRVNRLDLTSTAGFGVLSLAWMGIWTRANNWFVTTPMIVSLKTMQDRRHDLLTSPGGLGDAIGRIIWAILHGQSNNMVQGGSRSVILAWSSIALLVVILVLATLARTGSKPDLVFSWCFTLLGLGVLALTYLALWLQYSNPGLPGVQGMQLRYFLPLALGCALAAFTSVRALLVWFRNRHRVKQGLSELADSA